MTESPRETVWGRRAFLSVRLPHSSRMARERWSSSVRPSPLASSEGLSCASSAPPPSGTTGQCLPSSHRACSARGSLLCAAAPCWWQAPAGGTHLLLLVWVCSYGEEHGAGLTPSAGKTRRRCLLFLTGASDPGLPRSAEFIQSKASGPS